MRITSGKFKSRIIKTPRGIRPTLDNVRKSMFDILGRDLTGAKVLDLFAGSGALGLEALSRGANSCVFVDNSRSSAEAIKDNLDTLGLSSSKDVIVVTSDAAKAITKLSKSGNKFDLVFLDPPYYGFLVKKILFLLGSYDILTKSSVVIAEHSKHDEVPSAVGELKLYRTVRYGDTCISFYRKG